MAVDDMTGFSMDNLRMDLALQLLSMRGLTESVKLIHRCSLDRLKKRWTEGQDPFDGLQALETYFLPRTGHSRIMKILSYAL